MGEFVEAATEKHASDGEHGQLCIALPNWLARMGYRIDGIGHWYDRRVGVASAITADRIAQDFALEYRHRTKIHIGYVTETLEALATKWQAKARAERISQVINRPATTEGRKALMAWLDAVLGRAALPHEIHVMLHWLWLVKRSMAGKSVEHHIMPVIVGRQGGGKTVAISKLLEPLAELAMKPCAAALVTDERWRPALSKYAVGFWDELDGLDRGDRASVKQVLTATHLPFRPMRTNRTELVPVITKFIGASNTPVATLFKDPTGTRRFYQMAAADRLAWDVINALDYTTVWTCVSEDEAAPLIPFLSAIQGEQEDQRFRDSVGQWLQDESWGPISYEGRHLAKATPSAGIPAQEAYERYRLWCLEHREDKPMGLTAFGGRMAEEGFERKRASKDASGKRPRYYQKMESYDLSQRPSVSQVQLIPHPESIANIGNVAEPGQPGTLEQTITSNRMDQQSMLVAELDAHGL